MHYHKCSQTFDNGQKCHEIVAACEGGDCAGNDEGHFCSIHHPDPEHHVEPTPPLKR